MSTSRRRGSIVLLGDSITQQGFSVGGWAARLANYYSRRADVLNRGFSGYTSEWALPMLKDLFDPSATPYPILVTVFFGANDAVDQKLSKRHVPLQRYKENLTKIVEFVRSVYPNSTRIVLIAPPPVDREQRLGFQKTMYKEKATGVLEREDERTKLYAEACEDIATSQGIPCVNLWSLMTKTGNIKKYLSDGLHFSSDGNLFAFEALVNTIQKHFPDIAVMPDPFKKAYGNSGSECKGLPVHFPWHDSIDAPNYTKTFDSIP
mmetsp:Transcript_19800/g.48447  ORF Transcript_19800/g.48447 Transcript_19800/m.48447 type:complete len:263 (-) Transcript_19800:229-1017(-)